MNQTCHTGWIFILLSTQKWGTMAHWLEHRAHNHKVVGSSHNSSSLCWVPEQDSYPALLLPTQVKREKGTYIHVNMLEGKTDSLVQEYVVYPNNKRVTTYIVEPGVNTNEIQMGTTIESVEFQFLLYFFFLFFTVLKHFYRKDKIEINTWVSCSLVRLCRSGTTRRRLINLFVLSHIRSTHLWQPINASSCS